MLDLPWNTPGLRSSSEGAADASIEAGVREVLRKDHILKREWIDVGVKDGVVTLSGRVRSAELRERAASLVIGVAGVRDVKNRIMVPGEPA